VGGSPPPRILARRGRSRRGREGEAALGLSVDVEGEGGMSLPSWLGLRVEEREGRGTVSLGA
jgi:hypothetical protein